MILRNISYLPQSPRTRWTCGGESHESCIYLMELRFIWLAESRQASSHPPNTFTASSSPDQRAAEQDNVSQFTIRGAICLQTSSQRRRHHWASWRHPVVSSTYLTSSILQITWFLPWLGDHLASCASAIVWPFPPSSRAIFEYLHPICNQQ